MKLIITIYIYNLCEVNYNYIYNLCEVNYNYIYILCEVNYNYIYITYVKLIITIYI